MQGKCLARQLSPATGAVRHHLSPDTHTHTLSLSLSLSLSRSLALSLSLFLISPFHTSLLPLSFLSMSLSLTISLALFICGPQLTSFLFECYLYFHPSFFYFLFLLSLTPTMFKTILSALWGRAVFITPVCIYTHTHTQTQTYAHTNLHMEPHSITQLSSASLYVRQLRNKQERHKTESSLSQRRHHRTNTGVAHNTNYGTATFLYQGTW